MQPSTQAEYTCSGAHSQNLMGPVSVCYGMVPHSAVLMPRQGWATGWLRDNEAATPLHIAAKPQRIEGSQRGAIHQQRLEHWVHDRNQRTREFVFLLLRWRHCRSGSIRKRLDRTNECTIQYLWDHAVPVAREGILKLLVVNVVAAAAAAAAG
jgi:hypothetical protein